MKKTALIIVTVLSGVLVMGAAGRYAGRFGGATMQDKQRMFKAIMDAKIDIVGDKIGLSENQKGALRDARDDVIAEFLKTQGVRTELRREFLDLFQRDRISRSDLDAFAKKREQKLSVVKDRFLDAIIEVHDTLTPDQRKKAAELIADRIEQGLR